ncbi:MAG: hypothetical protein ACI35T_03665 [Alistipes sp.]
MKRAFIAIFGVITIFFNSCSLLQSPELYEEEIRDCVKFHLAEEKYIDSNLSLLVLSAITDDVLDKLNEHILDIYKKPNMSYRDALVRIANDKSSDYHDEAKKLCKLYDTMQIDLSDYEPARNSPTEKSWTFTELNSGTEFIFKIEADDKQNIIWSCYPLEQSLSSYIEKLLE